VDFSGKEGIQLLNFIDGDSVLQVGYNDGIGAFYDLSLIRRLLQMKLHNEYVRGSAWYKKLSNYLLLIKVE